MPRKNRLFIDGIPHLVKLSGHNDEVIFKDDEDISNLYHCVDNALAIYSIKPCIFIVVAKNNIAPFCPGQKKAWDVSCSTLGKVTRMISTTDISDMARCGIAVMIYAVEPNAYFLLVKNILNVTALMSFPITALPMRRSNELHLMTSIYVWVKMHYNVAIFINSFASAA